jgi:iduronate 2-sulfatase
MNNHINYFKFLFYIMAALLMGLSSCSSGDAGDAPYNVLFIAVDDLRPELNCYGATQIHSPNFDRLAANGVRFTGAQVQQSICMASRASLLTGYRPERNGIYTGEPVQDLVPGVTTLNKLFAQNGYSVSGFGKIYHYGQDQLEQFGEEFMDPTDKLPGRGYYTDEAIEQMQYNASHPLKGRNHEDRGPAFESADVPDSAYIDGYNTEYALRKLEQYKEEGKPFFMAMGFHKPHLPFCAPKKYWDMYPIESIKPPDIKVPPENSNQYTLRDWGELRNYYGMPKSAGQPVGADTTLILRQGYYACVSYVDALLGKLLDQLETLDLADNTIIILWGDHGWKLGDYGSWCKWSDMDIDTRVPLIINVPGGKKNVQCNALVELLDMYPTLADLCGLEIPEHVEGRSLVPLLNDPEMDWREYVTCVWPHYRTEYDRVVMGYSIKTERYNYVEWIKLESGKILERELYDHQTDPRETKNVIAEPEYADDILILEAMCKPSAYSVDSPTASSESICQRKDYR